MPTSYLSAPWSKHRSRRREAWSPARAAARAAGVVVALLLGGCGDRHPARPPSPPQGPAPPTDAGAGDAPGPAPADLDASAVADATGAEVLVEAGANDTPAPPVPAEVPPCQARSFGAGLRALAAAGGAGRIVAGYQDGAIPVFHPDLSPQRTLAAGGAARRVAVTADGAFVAVATDDGSLRLMSVNDERALWSLAPSAARIESLAFSADDRDLLVRVGGAVRLYQREGGRLVWSVGAAEDLVSDGAVPFFLEDEGLVFVHREGGAELHRRVDGAVARRLQPPFPDQITYFMPSPRGDLLVGRDGGGTHLLVVRSTDLSLVKRVPGAFLNPLAFSPDGQTLLTEAEVAASGVLPSSWVVQPWKVEDWTPLPAWGDRRDLALIVAGPGAQQVLVADTVGRVRLVDARTGQAGGGGEVVGRGHHREVVDLEFSPNGRWLVSQGDDRGGQSALLVWAAGAGAPAHAIMNVSAGLHAFAFSPDGEWLYVVRASGDLDVLETATGRRDRRLGTGVACVATGPDPEAIYACGTDRRLRVYRPSDGSARVLGPELPVAASALTLAPRAGHALVAGEGGAFLMLRLTDGQTLWEHVELSARGRASLTFSPDETLVAATTFHGNRTLLLLDARTGDLLPHTLEYDWRGAAAFAPGGRLVAVGTIDGAKLLRLPERSHVHTLDQRNLNGRSMGLAFAPRGDQMLMGLRFGRVDAVCDLATRFVGP